MLRRFCAFWLLVVLTSCGASAPHSAERITKVPPYVLTAEDLRYRMRRLGSELWVNTQGVLVHGVCVSSCETNVGGKCVALINDQPDDVKPIAVLLESSRLEPGKRYVLQGSVEPNSAVRGHWLLRAQVLAEVASLPPH